MSSQIKIGAEFFKKIKLDYADWRWALMREFLQNCFDAPGCRNVTVVVERRGSDTFLSVGNDGAPMDRETLVNKLLTLGGSGKNFDGENTGGFGVAKSLLYYCHCSYSICTGDLLVQGQGAQYVISDASGTTDGTVSGIVVEGDEVTELTEMVKKFAGMAQWKGTLTLNGQVLTTNLHKGARRKDIGWAVVYTNNSFNNICIVRLNGQPMFTCWTRFKGCVLLELTGKACATLTSNRDGLVRPYSSQLSDLLTALAVDKRSALREQRAEYKRYAGELQRNEAKKPKAIEDGLANVVDVGQIAALVRGNESLGAGEQAAQQSGGIQLVVASKEDAPASITVGPQFILKNTTGMKIPARFVPGDQFCEMAKGVVRAWTCVLLKLHQLCNRGAEFSVGFCFDEESEAESETAVYGQVYYINPGRVVESSKRRQIESRFDSAWKDRFQLISLACHEFVHGAFGLAEHDEDYASKLTDVMTIAMRHNEELTQLCRPVAVSEPTIGKKRIDVFGHASSAVLRWMGAQGWSFDQARNAMASLDIVVADGSIRTFLQAGKHGQRGEPAPLTAEQVEILEGYRY